MGFMYEKYLYYHVQLDKNRSYNSVCALVCQCDNISRKPTTNIFFVFTRYGDQILTLVMLWLHD